MQNAPAQAHGAWTASLQDRGRARLTCAGRPPERDLRPSAVSCRRWPAVFG